MGRQPIEARKLIFHVKFENQKVKTKTVSNYNTELILR